MDNLTHIQIETKTFYETGNIGQAKYVVSFHDGTSTHLDGSPFFGIRIFKNKQKKNLFVRELRQRGYIERQG